MRHTSLVLNLYRPELKQHGMQACRYSGDYLRRLAEISIWKIGPPANIFESAAFSKNLPTDGSYDVLQGNSRLVKLLTCAECDLGPIGGAEGDSSGGVTYHNSYVCIIDGV